MLERAPLARPLGVEERQLAAPRVRADQRERVGPVDDVHPDAGRDEVGDRVAVGDPERDVVERLRFVDRVPGGIEPRVYFAPVDRTLELLPCSSVERPSMFIRLASL